MSQISTDSNIKLTTVALYLLKSLVEAKHRASASVSESESSNANAKDDGSGVGVGVGVGDLSLLSDFTSADRMRLAYELTQAGPQCSIAKSRFHTLAKSLGWSEVATSPPPPPPPSASASASPNGGKRKGNEVEPKRKSGLEKSNKIAHPTAAAVPIVVDLLSSSSSDSDNDNDNDNHGEAGVEVDVIDSSR